MSLSQLNEVYLCKLSSVLSERAFKNHLQIFTERIEKKIMILVWFMHIRTLTYINAYTYVHICIPMCIISIIGHVVNFLDYVHARDIKTNGKPCSHYD